MTIQKAAVIGAGSMGSGIAALMASAGIDVVLFDMTKEGAQKGIDTQLKRQGFYAPEHAERVTPASTESDLALLNDCDWVVEAIFENLQAKHDLYAKAEPNMKDSAILSSNTSTIPLAQLLEGVQRKDNFAITHFFNPPKVMKLVELVAPHAETEAVLRPAIEQQLGKVALDCRDTPGFIANRVGCFWMASGVNAAREQGLSYELADAAFGRTFGIPRTGIFGLLDYIGLQLVAPIWGSLEAALSPDDKMHQFSLGKDEFIAGLVERGHTGRTGDGGFYRGRNETVTEDYSYREREKPTDPALESKDPREFMDTDSPAGRFARQLFLSTLDYCCTVAPEIADNVALIDDGLKLGFGWKKGIFELADAVGHDWLVAAYGDNAPELVKKATNGFYPSALTVLSAAGEEVDRPKQQGAVSLIELKVSANTVLEEKVGALHLLPSGVAIIDLHTPLNSLPGEALEFLRKCAERAGEGDIKALVIGNDEPRAFSAGADLPTLAKAAKEGDANFARQLISAGSQTMRALRNCRVPVVGAVRGVALGGGLELAMGCDRLVVAADTRIGFPERFVGLFPAWTGTATMLERAFLSGDENFHQKAFDIVAGADTHPNAFVAKDLGILQDEDKILMSADHVLARAIAVAEEMISSYKPRENTVIPLYQGETPLDAAWPREADTENDAVIAKEIARVYTASDRAEITFDELCEREVDLAIPVLMLPANVERTAHMAATRKPLRN